MSFLKCKFEKAKQCFFSNSKISMRMLTLFLVGSMSVCICSFSACASNNVDNTTEGTSTTQPSGNQGTNSNLSKHSKILQTVLTNEYYIKVADMYVNNYGTSNVQLALPYSFLRKQGFDIEKIKNDNLNAITTAYIKNGDKSKLYLSVKIENESSNGDFYSNYILSYPLTSLEYNDLEMLHSGKYIQAPYFIQEFDNQKVAKVESFTKISVEALDMLNQAYSNYCGNLSLNKNIVCDVVEIKSANLLTIEVRTLPEHNKMYSELRSLRISELKLYSVAQPVLVNNVLYCRDISKGNGTNIDEFKNNSTDITYFQSQYVTPTSYLK